MSILSRLYEVFRSHFTALNKPVLANDARYNQAFMGYRGATKDITTQVKAKEDLRISEERFKLATLGAKLTVWDWNIKTGEYYVSEGTAEIYGYSEREKPTTKQEWIDLIHPEDLKNHKEKLVQHLKGKTALFEHEYRLQRRDGNFSWILTQGRAQRSESGEAWRISGWGLDVTEQRYTERLLFEAINSLSEGFAVHDADDKLIAFNQEYSDMFANLGLSIEIGQTYEENLHKVNQLRSAREGTALDKEDLAQLLQAHLNPPPYMERMISDGRWIRTTEVKTPSGGVAGLRTDITKYKNVLDRLEKSEERSRAFADIASNWHFELDKDLRYTFMSPGIKRHRDFDPSMFIGKTFEEISGNSRENETHRVYIDSLKVHEPRRDILVKHKIDGSTRNERVGFAFGAIKNM